MPASSAPERVTIDTASQSFTIDWADGHQSVWALDRLRRACPCAHCRDRTETSDPSTSRRWSNVKIEPVGSYGLRFTWDDGHNDGIYTWKHLRSGGNQAAPSKRPGTISSA